MMNSPYAGDPSNSPRKSGSIRNPSRFSRLQRGLLPPALRFFEIWLTIEAADLRRRRSPPQISLRRRPRNEQMGESWGGGDEWTGTADGTQTAGNVNRG